MGRTGCCSKGYSTRAYDPSTGNIQWSANYFGKSTTGAVYTQALDSARVYVGGTRVASGGSHWSLACFDVATGALQWTRDVANDISLASTSVIQLRIDNNGYCVCMMQPANTGGTQTTQYFVVVKTDGTLSTTRNFVIDYSGGVGTGHVGGVNQPVGFTINSSGDYHVVGQDTVGSVDYIVLWEWLSPFSALPTEIQIAHSGTPCENHLKPYNIDRFNGQDIIAGIGAVITSNLGPGGLYAYHYPGPSLALGKVQSGAWASWSDVLDQWANTNIEYNQLPNWTSTATPAGTDQSSATALSVGDVVEVNPGVWTSDTGFRLPSGSSIGDQVSIEGTVNSGGLPIGTDSSLHATIYMYPPSGGTINGGQINGPVIIVYGDVYTCEGSDRWVQQNTLNVETFKASGGNASNYAAVLSTGALEFFNSSLLGLWKKGNYHRTCCLDSSSNVYAQGILPSSGPSIVARDSSGKYLWAHRHLGSVMAASPVPTNCILMDLDGDSVVASGYNNQGIGSGPCFRSNDIDFMVNPYSPYIGRTVTATDNGSHSAYQIGLSGGAAVNGTWLAAIILDDGTGNTSFQGAGATGWNLVPPAGGGDNFDGTHSVGLWLKLCGTSEPANYSITSTGSGSSCCIVEILGANSVNTDDAKYTTNASASPAALSSSTDDLILVVAADWAAIGGFTAPSGYTLDCLSVYGPSTLLTAIAHKMAAGIGSITPPAWGSPETAHNYLFSVTFRY